MKPTSRQSEYVVTCRTPQEVNTVLSYIKDKTTRYTDWNFVFNTKSKLGATNKITGHLKKLPVITFDEWIALPALPNSSEKLGTFDFTMEKDVKLTEHKLVVQPKFIEVFNAIIKAEFPFEINARRAFDKNEQIVKVVEDLGFASVFKLFEIPKLPKIHTMPNVEGVVEKDDNKVLFRYGSILLNRSWFLGNKSVAPVEIKLSNGQVIGERDVENIKHYLQDMHTYQTSTINS